MRCGQLEAPVIKKFTEQPEKFCRKPLDSTKNSHSWLCRKVFSRRLCLEQTFQCWCSNDVWWGRFKNVFNFKSEFCLFEKYFPSINFAYKNKQEKLIRQTHKKLKLNHFEPLKALFPLRAWVNLISQSASAWRGFWEKLNFHEEKFWSIISLKSHCLSRLEFNVSHLSSWESLICITFLPSIQQKGPQTWKNPNDHTRAHESENDE